MTTQPEQPRDEVAEAEMRGYHEGYSVALVDVATEVLRMDADGWSDRGALVAKSDVEAALRTMVSDHGIVGQALTEARANALGDARSAVEHMATPSSMGLGHRGTWGDGQRDALAAIDRLRGH